MAPRPPALAQPVDACPEPRLVHPASTTVLASVSRAAWHGASSGRTQADTTSTATVPGTVGLGTLDVWAGLWNSQRRESASGPSPVGAHSLNAGPRGTGRRGAIREGAVCAPHAAAAEEIMERWTTGVSRGRLLTRHGPGGAQRRPRGACGRSGPAPRLCLRTHSTPSFGRGRNEPCDGRSRRLPWFSSWAWLLLSGSVRLPPRCSALLYPHLFEFPVITRL